MLTQSNNCFVKGAAFISKCNFLYLEKRFTEMTDIKEKQKTGVMEPENAQRWQASWVLPHSAPKFADPELPERDKVGFPETTP